MENMNMGSGKTKTELTELEKERIKGRAEAMGILYTLFQRHINGLENLQGKFFDDIPEMKNMVECFRQSSDMLVDYVFAEAGQGLGLALTSTIEKDNLKMIHMVLILIGSGKHFPNFIFINGMPGENHE
ncbi:MAG: hypothetical protein ACI4UV_17205 [Victivallales bacterium]